MANIYDNLGSAYFFKGLLKQALANNSKSIQIKKELVKRGELKENDIVYLRSIQNLSDIYDRLGKSVEALIALQRAIGSRFVGRALRKSLNLVKYRSNYQQLKQL